VSVAHTCMEFIACLGMYEIMKKRYVSKMVSALDCKLGSAYCLRIIDMHFVCKVGNPFMHDCLIKCTNVDDLGHQLQGPIVL